MAITPPEKENASALTFPLKAILSKHRAVKISRAIGRFSR